MFGDLQVIFSFNLFLFLSAFIGMAEKYFLNLNHFESADNKKKLEKYPLAHYKNT